MLYRSGQNDVSIQPPPSNKHILPVEIGTVRPHGHILETAQFGTEGVANAGAQRLVRRSGRLEREHGDGLGSCHVSAATEDDQWQGNDNHVCNCKANAKDRTRIEHRFLKFSFARFLGRHVFALNRRNEAVTFARYGNYESMIPCTFAEGAPERGDLLREIILLHRDLAPNSIHQFAFRQRFALIGNQHRERSESLRRQLHNLSFTKQLALQKVKPESAEFES